MADLKLHVDGTTLDHVGWDADEHGVDEFDDVALEEAIRRSRLEAYAALARLDDAA